MVESERHKQLKDFAAALCLSSGWQREEVKQEYIYKGTKFDVAVIPNSIRSKPIAVFEVGNLNIRPKDFVGKPNAREWYVKEGILCFNWTYALPEMKIVPWSQHEVIQRLQPIINRLLMCIQLYEEGKDGLLSCRYPREQLLTSLDNVEEQLLLLLHEVRVAQKPYLYRPSGGSS